MINRLLKNKVIVGVIIIGILLLLIEIFFLFFNKKSATPTPINIFTFPSPTLEQNKQPLNITSISPAQNTTKQYSPSQQLEITFSAPVNANQIKYSIVPFVKATLFPKQGYDRIILMTPNPGWITGITTITFLQETLDLDGIKLSNDYTYKIKTDFLDTAPANSPGL